METENKNKPTVEKTRTERIEEFLLNPEKVVFESLEEFQTAVAELLDLLSAIPDIAKLQMLKGTDGKTPVRGVDYMNEEDIAAIEDFLVSKIPVVGKDLPSRIQVEEFVRREVAKLPRIKGDQGEQGKPGKNGKDGSPDTGADIIRKLRALDKNQKLQISDIRGLENALKNLATSEEVEELKAAIEDRKIVFGAPAGGGEGGSGGLENITGLIEEGTSISITGSGTVGDPYVINVDGALGTGDMLAATYDPNGVAGDAFDMENMAEGATNKILTVAERAKLAFISITQAVNLDTLESDVAAIKTKADHISVSQAVNLDTMESDIASAKTKTDFITVTQAVDLDTMETQAAAGAAAKVKTDFLTVTQAVDLDAIETRVNDLDAAIVLRGTWDASSGSFPGGGTAQAGSSYIVSVAGTVNSVSFAVGDRIIAITDNASTSTFAANWFKADYTDLVSSVAGLVGAISAADLKTALSLVKADVGLGNVDNTSDATKNAATATLTNKRITKRIGTTASSSTPTPDADANDVYTVTALAAGATFGAPTGTPTDGQPLVIRIKDNGTARTLAWNAIYRAVGVTLPTTTVISKTLYLGMFYNSADTKWDVVAVAQEA